MPGSSDAAGSKTGGSAPLRVGFVSIRRPLFKGDAEAAARRSRAGLERLGAAEGFVLASVSEAVADAAGARRVAEDMASADLDLLLVQLTTFATGDVLAPLAGAAKAVGLWGLPEASGGRGARGPLPLNSLCGLTMAMSLQGRDATGGPGGGSAGGSRPGPVPVRGDPGAGAARGDPGPVAVRGDPGAGAARDDRGPVPVRGGVAPGHASVKWFYGEHDAPAFRRRLAVTLAALRGMRALAGARILAIGGTAPGFYALDEVPTVAGVEVVRRDLAELFERAAAAPAAEVVALASAYRRREAADVDDAQLERAARIDLALAALARSVDADALAVRCWPELPDACGSMACAAMGNRSGDDMPAACEGDVMGAVSMLALQGVTAGPAILMDLSDVDASDDSLQLWHCGNAPLAWAAGGARGTRLTTHFNRDGVGVVRDMRLAEGPVTGLRLLAGGRRAVVVKGDVRPAQRAAFDGVSGWIGDLAWAHAPLGASAFVANLLDRRLPHHLAFGRGDAVDAVLELCARLGAEVLPARDERPYLRAPRAPGGV